ncbi:MAG: putative bifunctional diguanylate cyclase/phosphodiesterase, partial [Acidimicrobiales bacterium]
SSHIRGLAIDALTNQALVLTNAVDQQHLLALSDMIEDRSAHLDERVAVELARRYSQWAPGLHSAVVSSVANQSDHLDNANRFLFGGDELHPPKMLVAWRKEISISDDAPRINARAWASLSDSWIGQLGEKIDQQRVRTMSFLADEESAAKSTQWGTIMGVSIAMLLAMLITSVVSVRLVRRVSIITQQARRMATGSATERTSPEVRGTDELGQLATAFDEMTTQIETRTKNQWIESTVLESIVHGASIDEVMEQTAPLLGTREQGTPIYRFVSDEDRELALEMRSPEAGNDHNATGRAESLMASDAPEVRTAIGLVKMARQRDDDHAKLAWQASRDELTGLLNRGAILGKALAMVCPPDRDSPRPGLLYIDLDDFKAINDQFGHSAGDRVLIAQSSRLMAVIADWNGVGGRLGGDEFLVLLPAVEDEDSLRQLADRLVVELAEPIPSKSGSFQVGVSIGGVLTRPDVPALKLLNDADAALYQAKKKGRGQGLVSTQQLRDEILETEQLRRDVLQGLESEQFSPWFQPIWGDGGVSLDGMEALARWQHPDRGLVSPGVFLPVAEELNLLSWLDRQMFTAVCRQVVAWREAGFELEMVHYNMSTAWLEEPNFVRETSRILRETGCPPEAIVAEVTESGLMTDISSNSHRLQELREIGIRIAVDDFGQGYSSLAYLSDLPVDLLKIDRRFVDHIDLEESNQAIVSAVVSLGASLGLRIVAEGVERTEELDYLTEAGSDLFQGFLLARPLPANEATALLGRRRPPGPDLSADRFAKPSTGESGLGAGGPLDPTVVRLEPADPARRH